MHDISIQVRTTLAASGEQKSTRQNVGSVREPRRVLEDFNDDDRFKRERKENEKERV